MTSTNQAIITEAATRIGLVADGKQPTPTQSAQSLVILNDNMATQQRDGWRLGWYPQVVPTALTAIAPLRDEDIGDVKLCLCFWMASFYGIKFDPDSSLPILIEQAFERLNKRSLLYTECDLGELQRPQGGPWGGPNWL